MSAYPGTTGEKLTMAGVISLLEAADCPDEWLFTLAAIPFFESGGITNNLNNNPDTHDYSVGLWQINYFGSLFPAREARFGAPAQLASSAASQAKAAVAILGGGPGITAWVGDPIGTAAQPGPLSLAEIEDIFYRDAGVLPSTGYLAGVGPNPAPPKPTPPPIPKEYENMGCSAITIDAAGNWHFTAVAPPVNGEAGGHPLHFECKPAAEGQDQWSYVDVNTEVKKVFPETNVLVVP